MGDFVISPITKITAWAIAGILVFLNLSMLTNEVASSWSATTVFSKIGFMSLGLLSFALLLYILLFPLFKTVQKSASIQMHPDLEVINQLTIPEFKIIAIALDFSDKDQKLLSFAIGQGKENTRYVLVHVVESASAKLLGTDSDDYETRKDKERMDWYVSQLQQRGYLVEGHLGFRNRAKEIVRIVKELNADMLVAGAHGHTGLKDFIYGETVNTVRHELKIPVLIVNV
jgi:manganese transport protein